MHKGLISKWRRAAIPVAFIKRVLEDGDAEVTSTVG